MPRDWADTNDEYMDMIFNIAKVIRAQNVDAYTACVQLWYCD